MCIRDRAQVADPAAELIDEGTLYGHCGHYAPSTRPQSSGCLLYTSDAADDLLCVDLGGRRIIKKKKSHIIINVAYN